MKKIKLLSLTLASLLVSSSALSATSIANAQSNLKNQGIGTEKQPRKSQITAPVLLQENKASKKLSVPRKSKTVSLVESKLKSKLKKTVSNKHTYQSDELIVQYKKNPEQPKINALKQKFSLKQGKQLKSINAEVVKIPKGKNLNDLKKELEKDPSVESVQPNYKYYATTTNNAPNYYSQLWGMNNTGQSITGMPGIRDIDVDAPEARTNFNGKLKPVLVGVLDTGVDINHPDLQSKIWTNPGEIPNDGIDNDHDGYVDDVHGWDFYNKDDSVYDPMDGDEHGTHVSGIIAGTMEGTSFSTNKGIAGVAPNVKIVPIKFMGPDGGTSADAIAGIEYAQKLGIKILNNSWGGDSYDPLLEKAIKNYNGLFVVAAGNDASDNDTVKTYPASFDSPNILTVAALDNQGNLADFSNYGANTVDVAAPGVNILSSVPKYPDTDMEDLLGIKQLGASAQIVNPASKSKVVFDGVGFEKYGSTDRLDAFTKALNFLDIPKDSSKKILLVQDDEHDLANQVQDVPELQNYFKDYLSTYTSLLKGYNYTTTTISSVSSIKESGIDLASYDAVIWFTGHGMGIGSLLASGKLDLSAIKSLTADDITALTNYLNNGGHLLLSGQDALSGNDSSPFVTDLLHLNAFPDMGPSLNVQGLTGGIYSGKKYAVNQFDSIFPAADFIESNNPNAVVNLKYVSDYSQAYSYESGTSMATPYVTGAAAVLLGLNPNMAPELLKLYVSNDGKKLWQLNGFVKSSSLVKESKLNTFNDNNVPGVPLTKNIINDSLNASTDKNDVYALALKQGEAVNLSLTGQTGTDFDLYMYGPSAKNVNTANGLVGYSENVNTSKEGFVFKAPKAGVYYVDVYAYKGAGSYNLKVGNFGGTYENDSKFLTYTGKWATTKNAQFSNGTASSLNSIGEADFSFVGYNFEWKGFKDSTQGIADIYIDGVKEASPSLYAKGFQANQTIYKKTFAAYGKHNVQIVWTGKSDPSGRKNAAAINIDQFIVRNIPNRVAVNYDSTKKHPIVSWTASSWAASYNVYRKEASQADFTKINSAPVTGLTFTDASAVFGKTYIYAVSMITKDNQETGLSTPVTYILDDDIKGNHAITSSSVIGTLNVASKDLQDVWSKHLVQGKTYEFDLTGAAGTDFNLYLFKSGTSTTYGTSPYKKSTNKGSTEKITFKPGKSGLYYLVPLAKSGTGWYKLSLSIQTKNRIENTSSSIKYSGGWTKVGYSGASGRSVSQTNKTKSSVRYSFTGTGIRLLALKNKDMGKAYIYLDGRKVKTIDLYSSKKHYKQVVFDNQSLSNKKHTITIVATGKKNKSSKGKTINIDGFDMTHFIPFK